MHMRKSVLAALLIAVVTQQASAQEAVTKVRVARKITPGDTVAPVSPPDAAVPTNTAPTVEVAVPAKPSPAAKHPGGMHVKHKSPGILVEMFGPPRITVGKKAVYTFKLTNSEAEAVDDLTVLIAIPDYAEVTSAVATAGDTGAMPAGAGFLWKFDSLAASASHELELSLIPHKSQPIELEVRWSQPRPKLQATVQIDEPRLNLAVVGPVDLLFGQKQLFQFNVKNTGTGDAENVAVRVLAQTAGGPSHTLRVGTVKAGATETASVELMAAQVGEMQIQATAEGEGGLEASAALKAIVHRPGLELITNAPKAQYAGAILGCEVRVRNPGDAPARDVKIVAALPQGTEVLVAGQNGDYASKPGEVMWKLDELAPGAELVLDFKCKLVTPGNVSLAANGTAEGGLSHASSANVLVKPVAALTLNVVGHPGPIAVGTPTEYAVKICNHGTAGADDLEIVNVFSAGLIPAAIEGAQYEPATGSMRFKPSAVAAGTEATYNLSARAMKSGNHQLRVELQSKALGVRLTQEVSTFFYGDE